MTFKKSSQFLYGTCVCVRTCVSEMVLSGLSERSLRICVRSYGSVRTSSASAVLGKSGSIHSLAPTHTRTHTHTDLLAPAFRLVWLRGFKKRVVLQEDAGASL